MSPVAPPPKRMPREALVSAILEFLGEQDLLTLHDIRVALEQEIDAAGPRALLELKDRLTADSGWSYYPADPLVRRIHRLLADRFLSPDSQILRPDHLASVAGRRLVLCANHLSYADANVVEVLLHRGGGSVLADRLTALAGPKVFSERQRRFSSLCFGTIKVPQSSEVSSEDAVLSTREVARAARRAIAVTHERLAAGDAVLLFGEGTRSRSAEMRPLLHGVARYLELPDTWVLPVALIGPEQLFPIGDSTLRPCRVVMHLGTPFRADDLLAAALHDRRTAVDAIGLAIADLLPPGYRGAYGNSAALLPAGRVLTQARRRTHAPAAVVGDDPSTVRREEPR